VTETSQQPLKESANATSLRLFVTTFLLAATLAYQGYQAFLAFDLDDTNHLETPLLLATARQLTDGPSTLYGPFSGSDPLVLIHAPLYYRLSGLIAWPLTSIGRSPVLASMIAGRGLSFLGFLLIIGAAWRIARLDGASWLAGFWAALLIASSPVFGSFGFSVRPDTLGIAFQTIGLGLILGGLRIGPTVSIVRWIGAGVCFGLAVCTKQHLIVSAAVGLLLVFGSVLRGRTRRQSFLALLAASIAGPLLYYSLEEWLTGGMMSRSVFVLPSRLRQTAPASWGHVATVFFDVAKRSVGLLALVMAVLIGNLRAVRGKRLDAALWFVFLAELAAMVPLCLGSTGSWANYAMPAIVWGSILLARSLIRAIEPQSIRWKTWLLVPASLVLVASCVRLSLATHSMRNDEARLMDQILSDPIVAATPASRIFFEDMPQRNRLYGRPSLAYDRWLYESYESLAMAEPRQVWLFHALTDRDSIRIVIVPSKRPEGGNRVQGLTPSLPEMGYRIHQQYGQYAVWVRDDLIKTDSSGSTLP
jgi:hypothetical protein